MAHTRWCWISKATCTHAHAQFHAPGQGRAHTQICNIYWFYTGTTNRERTLMLRYTYIACLVTFSTTLFQFLSLVALAETKTPHHLTDVASKWADWIKQQTVQSSIQRVGTPTEAPVATSCDLFDTAINGFCITMTSQLQQGCVA
jgi:hypothetical protein